MRAPFAGRHLRARASVRNERGRITSHGVYFMAKCTRKEPRIMNKTVYIGIGRGRERGKRNRMRRPPTPDAPPVFLGSGASVQKNQRHLSTKREKKMEAVSSVWVNA